MKSIRNVILNVCRERRQSLSKNFFQKTIDKWRGMCYNNNVRKTNTTERGTEL